MKKNISLQEISEMIKKTADDIIKEQSFYAEYLKTKKDLEMYSTDESKKVTLTVGELNAYLG